MKIGLVDAGGGMRGSYSAGVLDAFLDGGLKIDYACGVSAGAGNIASFLAGQRGRNIRFYADYSYDKEYMGLGPFLKHGCVFNVGYIYGDIIRHDGKDPIDFAALMANTAEFEIVASDALTGLPRYFPKSFMKLDDYRPFMASASIPVFCRPFIIDGIPYYDGAISDPVPIRRAEEKGCNLTIVILTRPVSALRTPEKDVRLSKFLRRYPAAASGLSLRAERYNEEVAYALGREKEGKAVVVNPESLDGMSTMKRDRNAIMKFYERGLRDGERALAKIAGSGK